MAISLTSVRDDRPYRKEHIPSGLIKPYTSTLTIFGGKGVTHVEMGNKLKKVWAPQSYRRDQLNIHVD